MGREIEKKILASTSVHTRPGQENSEENSKKKQKIKKPLSGIIFSQNGIRLAEKEKKKNFSPGFGSNLTRAWKFWKKSKKKFKNLFPALFLAKTGWDRPKKREKNFIPEFHSYSTRARKFRKK